LYFQPADGMLIGFDFQVNDDGAGNGTRSAIAKWNDPTNNSYMNTSKFGLLQFVE
jgi:endo-1,4-beta-xylanase